MEDNNANISGEITSLGGKAWTAYIGLIFGGFALLFIVTPLIWSASLIFGLIFLALSLAFLVYQYLHIKSYHLYFDDMGVWIYSGILPWSKGVLGVKWRDLDEAVYFQSIWSWLFKSYSIRIGHRFTKSSEIFLSHWSHGQDVVMTINGKHQELVRADALS